MDNFAEAWVVISDYCKKQITEVAYTTWIKKIIPVSLNFEKGEAVLEVPNVFHKQTIERCYVPLINDGFTAVFGDNFSIKFVLPEENTEIKPVISALEGEAGYDFTFDTFIVGSSNKFAHAAALAVATNPGYNYNPLFIYGNSGLGKTHLLYAISNDIKKTFPDKKIVYIKGDTFTNELIESLQKACMPQFRDKYRNADILLVDDVQFISGKISTQEEFFHTFDSLYLANKQIVLTSDRPPKEIKTLEDRIRSRFEQGIIADIQPPELETRIAIIKRKCEILKIHISDDICEFIANSLKTNIRQLEGVVKKLQAKSMLDGEEITLVMAKQSISDILNDDTPPEMTVEKIIDEVGRTYGFSADEIRSQKSRKANLSKVRQIAIYIVRSLTTLSMKDIGKEFGGRHYTTIVYTVQQVEDEMQKNSSIKENIEDIIKNIRDR